MREQRSCCSWPAPCLLLADGMLPACSWPAPCLLLARSLAAPISPLPAACFLLPACSLLPSCSLLPPCCHVLSCLSPPAALIRNPQALCQLCQLSAKLAFNCCRSEFATNRMQLRHSNSQFEWSSPSPVGLHTHTHMWGTCNGRDKQLDRW